MKIAAIITLVMIAIMLALLLKAKNPEISGLMSVAICIVIVYFCIEKLKIVMETINQISSIIKVDKTYIAILLKLIGIAYICEFGSNISKDAGYQAVAGQIELLGKLTMLVISLPVLLAVIQMILNLV